MKKIYLAQVLWCEREVPVCAGTNKKKLVQQALQRWRFCVRPLGDGSEPICADDIEIVELPWCGNNPCNPSQNPIH